MLAYTYIEHGKFELLEKLKPALQHERDFLTSQSGSLDMTFEEFAKLYREERGMRLKESTVTMKDNIIDTKLLPYFGTKRLRDITTKDVMKWQNAMLGYRDPVTGKPYSKSYLKTIHNQLSALFNHAVRYYKLSENPARTVGNMGSEKGIEMKYWTQEEYLKFAEYMMDDPTGYYYFQMLYWCGIRVGELLALTPADFDFKARTVTISKSYQRLHGEDIITSPKTPKSNRTIKMPKFLCEEIQEYIGMFYEAGENDRIFPITKSYLHHEMNRGSDAAGVKRIRIHDLRHSHVSLLIDKGFQPLAIADRVGHESVDITYRYAHLFPSKQIEMVNTLDEIWNGDDSNVG